MIKYWGIILLTLITLSCGDYDETSALVVTVQPTTPVLIDEGVVPINGEDVTAPLFIINQISVYWGGTDTVNILTLKFTGRVRVNNETKDYKCTIAGDDLSTAFSGTFENGVVPVAAGETVTSAAVMVCSGVPVPTPLPKQYNIPITVEVSGVVIDSTTSETIGRVAGRARITLK